MNLTDKADQLQNQYQPDYWMRNWKWCWPFLSGGLEWPVSSIQNVQINVRGREGGATFTVWKLIGGGMPKKWSHLEFMVELVYNLIFPSRTVTHLQTMSELDDGSHFSTKSLSSFELVNEVQVGKDVDLGSSTGWEESLRKKAQTVMTQQAMITNKRWPCQFDGMHHASLLVSDQHCQYCHFQYHYEFNNSQSETFSKMEKNRMHIWQCLVCNVNLCPACEIEFHGIQMCETAELLGNLIF